MRQFSDSYGLRRLADHSGDFSRLRATNPYEGYEAPSRRLDPPSYRSFSHQNRKAIQPETYDGTKLIEEYIENFECVSEWNRWDLEEMGMQLVMCLRGSAQLAVKALPESCKRDYVRIVSCLHTSFGDPNQGIIDQKEFWTRNRSAHESLVDFAHSLRSLGKKCFRNQADSGPAFEKMLVSRFVNGISNVELGRWIFMNDPHSLDDAAKIARDFEAYDKLNNYPAFSKPQKPSPVCAISSETRISNAVNAKPNSESEIMTLLQELSVGQKQILKELKKQGEEISSIKKQVKENTTAIQASQKKVQPVETPLQNNSNKTGYKKNNGGYNNSYNNRGGNYGSGGNGYHGNGYNQGQNSGYNSVQNEVYFPQQNMGQISTAQATGGPSHPVPTPATTSAQGLN